MRVYLTDLKKLINKTIIILTDSNNIFPKPLTNEKGFIYPHIDVLYPEYGTIYATIVIMKDKVDNIDDLCITFLHELIHLWLYTKDIYDHDEEWIEKEAIRLYNLEANSVKKMVKKYFKFG